MKNPKSFNARPSRDPRGYLWGGALKSVALASLFGLGLPACGGGDDGPAVAEARIALHAFDDCDSLLDYFQTEALAELQRWGWMGGGRAEWDAIGAPVAGNDGGQGGEAPPRGEPGVDYSATNNQEAGVDEPDRVKTDGTWLYVVQGQRVLIYRAADLVLHSEIPVGSHGATLLLNGDRLAVLGQRWGDDAVPAGVPARFLRTAKTEIAIYDVQDRAAPVRLRRTTVEGGLVTARLVGGTARVVVHFDAAHSIDFGALGGGDGGGGTRPSEPPSIDTGTSGSGGGPGEPEPTPAPIETREDPQAVDYEAAVRQLIEDSELEDWIPFRVDEAEGEAVAAPLAACRQFHRPGERAGHGVTAVVSVDLDRPEAGFGDPVVVTAPGVVYASQQSLYVTTMNHSGWLWGGRGDVAVSPGLAEPGDVAVDARGTESRRDPQVAEPLPERQASQIHKLSIAAADRPAIYRGSGRVFGVPLNQFSLGEHAEHLRIATTEIRVADFEPVNHLFVLGEGEVEGRAGLAVTGQVTDIAETERIYAVRLMGERGFMVTFRQVDPLFTLDLSDPRAPRLVGELKIPGFSTYLHPYGADHLIGIGQSADDDGRITGMQLSLFDVSDFADPRQAHVHALGQGWSDALYDHHAFLFWAPRDLLAIPVQNHGDWREDGEAPEARIGLDLFTVSAAAGFDPAGFVHHLGLGGAQWAPGIERSLIIGDRLYALSQVGVTAHALDGALAQDAHAVFPADPNAGRDGPWDSDDERPAPPELPEPAPAPDAD